MNYRVSISSRLSNRYIQFNQCSIYCFILPSCFNKKTTSTRRWHQQEGDVNKKTTWWTSKATQRTTSSSTDHQRHAFRLRLVRLVTMYEARERILPPPSHLKFSGFRNFWRTHNKVRLFKIQDLDRSASSLQPGIFFYLNWGSIAFVVLEFDERLRSSWYSLTKEGGENPFPRLVHPWAFPFNVLSADLLSAWDAECQLDGRMKLVPGRDFRRGWIRPKLIAHLSRLNGKAHETIYL